MGVPRRNAMGQQALRDRIKSQQIVDRLQKHIDATKKTPNFLMEDSQVRAALGLLKKVLPDLASMTIEGVQGGEPVRFILEGLDGK